MANILRIEDIKSALDSIDVISAMEEGFIQYSNGNSVVPPVGELLFNNPPGDVHIKYGYIKDDDYYVIKIASGFYENSKLGIPSGQGLMLLFNQKTGELVSILLDEGHLTDVRTAAAGALAAKYFSPSKIDKIGIVGTGVQAKLQLQFLQKTKPCRSILLWGRNKEKAEKLKAELGSDFDISITEKCSELTSESDIIITTTPSEAPLVRAEDVRPGTLIIAVGSDTESKQELESQILHKADKVVADSIPQSQSRGEVFRAIKDGAISHQKVIELGSAIQNKAFQRMDDEEIIVVDLTGVAVQDIMIASAVYSQIRNQS